MSSVARRSLRIEKLTRLASQSDLYPPEIWEHIFSHLAGLQMLRMRLVCRRWRDIITGCPQLMRKLRIRFETRKCREIPEDVRLLPVTEIIFQEYTVDSVPDWWAWVSQRLTHLTLLDCCAEISLLLAILRRTPNLRCLKIQDCFLEGTADTNNIQFPQLEELTLEKVAYDAYDENEYINLLDIFEKIFPRIKDLRIQKVGVNGFNEERLVSAIRTLANTLEALEIDIDRVNVVHDLFPDLTRLRRVSIHVDPSFELDIWTSFFRAQTLLDDLVIFTTNLSNNKVLCDIGRAVPNLKRLTLHVTNTFSCDFLEFMPNLQYLQVHGEVYEDIVLNRRGSPRVMELYLRDVDVTGFWSYLSQSPQLCRIVLNSCTLKYQSSNAKVFKHIRTLKIDDESNVPLRMLKSLLRKCPCLEEFTYSSVEIFKDSFPLLICERLKCLRKLSLLGCPITDEGVDHIVQHGRSLEEVRLSTDHLSDEAVGRLLAIDNLRVWLYEY